MKESIKTFRFTCDGWYYDEHNNMHYCQKEPSILILTGTKEEIENELARQGWEIRYLYGKEHEFLCSKIHFGESYKHALKLEKLTDDQKIDRFFNE